MTTTLSDLQGQGQNPEQDRSNHQPLPTQRQEQEVNGQGALFGVVDAPEALTTRPIITMSPNAALGVETSPNSDSTDTETTIEDERDKEVDSTTTEPPVGLLNGRVNELASGAITIKAPKATVVDTPSGEETTEELLPLPPVTSDLEANQGKSHRKRNRLIAGALTLAGIAAAAVGIGVATSGSSDNETSPSTPPSATDKPFAPTTQNQDPIDTAKNTIALPETSAPQNNNEATSQNGSPNQQPSTETTVQQSKTGGELPVFPDGPQYISAEKYTTPEAIVKAFEAQRIAWLTGSSTVDNALQVVQFRGDGGPQQKAQEIAASHAQEYASRLFKSPNNPTMQEITNATMKDEGTVLYYYTFSTSDLGEAGIAAGMGDIMSQNQGKPSYTRTSEEKNITVISNTATELTVSAIVTTTNNLSETSLSGLLEKGLQSSNTFSITYTFEMVEVPDVSNTSSIDVWKLEGYQGQEIS